jgi:hypothetical protein
MAWSYTEISRGVDRVALSRLIEISGSEVSLIPSLAQSPRFGGSGKPRGAPRETSGRGLFPSRSPGKKGRPGPLLPLHLAFQLAKKKNLHHVKIAVNIYLGLTDTSKETQKIQA